MLNVAVIGCGYWGPNLIRNLHENRLCGKIVACDRDPSKLQRIALRYPTVEVTTDADEAIARLDVDAVMIATPLSTHFELAMQALGRDRHVFVEKPFAASSEQARRLIG